MADDPEDRIPRPSPDESAAEQGISELQARLDELQRSVELLGTQGVWAARDREQPDPAPQAPVPPPPPVPPPYQPPIPPQPGPDVPPPAPAYEAPPAPAATNGHTDEEPGISGPTATVAMVDAGPFADLIELRHFEDDLSSLTAVHDVRVRRYGQGRAMIEVGMAGPYDLARELPRLGLPMDVIPGGSDGLVIEFAPLPSDGSEIEDPPPEDDGESGPA